MRFITLIIIFILWLLSAADHYTTYLMLVEPIPGWEIWEANPAARWLFDTFGLLPGLVADSVFTFCVGIWVYRTRSVSERTKIVCCAAVSALTWYAVLNNVQVLHATGVW